MDYLSEAYSFRYREDKNKKQFFKKGLKFCFSKYQTLMELDYTILRMTDLIKLFNQDTTTETTEGLRKAILSSKAHVQLEVRAELLREENFYFIPADRHNSRKHRREYLKDKSDYIVEYYIDQEDNHHELHYLANPKLATDFKSVLQGSIKLKENKYSFQPTYRPTEVFVNYMNSATYEKVSFTDEAAPKRNSPVS